MSIALSVEDRALLMKLEESLWRTETRFDRAYMENTLASDFLEFGRSGRVYKRADTLNMEAQPIDANLRDFDIRLVESNVALVTYVSEVAYGGIKEIGNRSSLWTRTANRWQLRFHQGTAV